MAEKARGVGNGLFGIILGVIETIFASFLISFSTYFGMWTADITRYSSGSQSYIGGLFGAAGFMIMFGGVYVLLHGIKRIIDHGFAAYLASKQQREPLPPPMAR